MGSCHGTNHKRCNCKISHLFWTKYETHFQWIHWFEITRIVFHIFSLTSPSSIEAWWRISKLVESIYLPCKQISSKMNYLTSFQPSPILLTKQLFLIAGRTLFFFSFRFRNIHKLIGQISSGCVCVSETYKQPSMAISKCVHRTYVYRMTGVS